MTVTAGHDRQPCPAAVLVKIAFHCHHKFYHKMAYAAHLKMGTLCMATTLSIRGLQIINHVISLFANADIEKIKTSRRQGSHLEF